MTDTDPLAALLLPINDGPWKRMVARIDAMPPGRDRTQAIVDMNAMLIEHRDVLRLRAAGVTLAQPADLGQQTVYSTPLGERITRAALAATEPDREATLDHWARQEPDHD